MAAFAFRDGVASSTSFGLILVLPFMTTWLACPVPGATLAIALAVAQALDFVPDGMGAALTAHMRRPRDDHWQNSSVLLTSECTVILGALALAVGSPLVGRLFGGQYSGAEFRTRLIVLAVGGPPDSLFDMDVGAARIAGYQHVSAAQHRCIRYLIASNCVSDNRWRRRGRRDRNGRRSLILGRSARGI